MRGINLPLVVSLAGCASAPVAVAPAPASVRPADISISLLQAHNLSRARVGNSPLTWDPALARAAAGYALQMASTDAFQHSPRATRSGQGENLWMGTRGAYSIDQMAGSWASEARMFRSGTFPAVSATGNWADVGHYSQMIWPTTSRIGCALASSRSADYLVCRYSPAGNIDGRRVP